MEAGALDVVFAVDMFNEGVDLPGLDTVMMLRPTESRILWLQQFGRGLRRAAGKECLTVIDYIGNHRTFLIKPQTLFSLGPGDAEVAFKLDQLQRGEAVLPPGCEVTYELAAIDILRGLLRSSTGDPTIRAYYADFKERHGTRPSASEAFHDGYNPRALRSGYGSWSRFVRAMGHVTRARVTQIMNLMLLAPAIQEELLFLPPVKDGHDPIKEWQVRPIAAEPNWERQTRAWKRLNDAIESGTLPCHRG